MQSHLVSVERGLRRRLHEGMERVRPLRVLAKRQSPGELHVPHGEHRVTSLATPGAWLSPARKSARIAYGNGHPPAARCHEAVRANADVRSRACSKTASCRPNCGQSTLICCHRSEHPQFFHVLSLAPRVARRIRERSDPAIQNSKIAFPYEYCQADGRLAGEVRVRRVGQRERRERHLNQSRSATISSSWCSRRVRPQGQGSCISCRMRRNWPSRVPKAVTTSGSKWVPLPSWIIRHVSSWLNAGR